MPAASPAPHAQESEHATAQPAAHQTGQEQFRVLRAEDVAWQAFAAFPAGAKLAVLVGDPTKPGPYVVRMKVPHSLKLMPHTHREDRVYTVISGVFYIGLGEEFDEGKLTPHAPGTVLVLPAGQAHFHCAKSGEYVSQVSAIGPLGLTYVDPSNDPRSGSR
jgi:quercetin dioxygenase-like cupin family protein